jgi:hypothetical protein
MHRDRCAACRSARSGDRAQHSARCSFLLPPAREFGPHTLHGSIEDFSLNPLTRP